MEILTSYEYPGNIRELENIIERAVALCVETMILPKHLPQEIERLCFAVYRSPSSLQIPTLEENERQYVLSVLKSVDGSKGKAAEIMGIDRSSLWRKLKRWGMDWDNSELP
ncbi:MAG: hypothetical protein GWN86_19955 [Desulfobacterales bacterium]|nr:hypothetical protein [Desulfobacterales bacterium]